MSTGKQTSDKRVDNSATYFLFLILGILLAVPTMIFVRFLADEVTTLTAVALIALLVVVVAGIFLATYRKRISHYLFQTASTQLEELVSPLHECLRYTISGNLEKAVDSAELCVRVLAARFSWFLARRWMLGTALAIMGAFAALVGTALVFSQNQLIDKQNQLMENQNTLVKKQHDFFVAQAKNSKDDEKQERIRRLRTELDLVLRTGIGESTAANLGATTSELLAEVLMLGVASENDPLQAKLDMADARTFLSLVQSSQIATQQAIRLIDQLEKLDSAQVTAADYLALSNSLFGSGQFSLSRLHAQKGLERSNSSLVALFTRAHVAKIDYAIGDLSSGQKLFSDIYNEITKLKVEGKPISSIEQDGYRALFSAVQAQHELAAKDKTKASELLATSRQCMARLPDRDREMRWRVAHLVDAVETQMREDNVLRSGYPTDDESVWEHVTRLVSSPYPIASETELVEFLMLKKDFEEVREDQQPFFLVQTQEQFPISQLRTAENFRSYVELEKQASELIGKAEEQVDARLGDM